MAPEAAVPTVPAAWSSSSRLNFGDPGLAVYSANRNGSPLAPFRRHTASLRRFPMQHFHRVALLKFLVLASILLAPNSVLIAFRNVLGPTVNEFLR
jgi:hypothetical protein